MSNPQVHMAGIMRAFAKTPEQRLETLMSSPYWELNQKYAARTEIRNAKRHLKYLEEKIATRDKLIAETQAQTKAAKDEIARIDAETKAIQSEIKKLEHEKLMKSLRANAAIKEFTASLKGSSIAPVATPVAPAPTKTAADVLQEMINKKYRLK